MRQRCMNPNSPHYPHYGGRGIRICERWNSYAAFESDMGPRPVGASLDRIDNDGDYTPENCRWATQRQQMRNQRCTRRVEIEGKQYVAVALADRSGLKTDTIVERAAKGLSLPEVLRPEKHVFHTGLALGGKASGAKRQAMTHCVNGHEFTPKNTRITKEGWRVCRRCKADRQLRYNRQKQ